MRVKLNISASFLHQLIGNDNNNEVSGSQVNITACASGGGVLERRLRGENRFFPVGAS